jgi:hypothetical protein
VSAQAKPHLSDGRFSADGSLIERVTGQTTFRSVERKPKIRKQLLLFTNNDMQSTDLNQSCDSKIPPKEKAT